MDPWNYYNIRWCPWDIRLFSQGGSCTWGKKAHRQLCGLLHGSLSEEMPEGVMLTIGAVSSFPELPEDSEDTGAQRGLWVP